MCPGLDVVIALTIMWIETAPQPRTAASSELPRL
jgi:hypothetical protein